MNKNTHQTASAMAEYHDGETQELDPDKL